MPDSDAVRERPTDRAAAHYTFERTEGRAEGLAVFDAALLWLDRRAQAHVEHSNDELLNLTKNISTEVLHAVERLCGKWEESDRKGLTY